MHTGGKSTRESSPSGIPSIHLESFVVNTCSNLKSKHCGGGGGHECGGSIGDVPLPGEFVIVAYSVILSIPDISCKRPSNSSQCENPIGPVGSPFSKLVL